MGGVKDHVMSLFKTKDYIKPKCFKTAYRSGKKSQKLKIEKQFEDNIIKNVRNFFKLKKENTIPKDRIIRDIKTLLEQQEEDYYKLVRVGNF